MRRTLPTRSTMMHPKNQITPKKPFSTFGSYKDDIAPKLWQRQKPSITKGSRFEPTIKSQLNVSIDSKSCKEVNSLEQGSASEIISNTVVEETTTTARPTTTTVPAPVYIQCAFAQECITAAVCSSRPGQENTNFGAVSRDPISFHIIKCPP